MLLTGNDGLNDGATYTQDIAGDHVQLDAGIFQDFVNLLWMRLRSSVSLTR